MNQVGLQLYASADTIEWDTTPMGVEYRLPAENKCVRGVDWVNPLLIYLKVERRTSP